MAEVSALIGVDRAVRVLRMSGAALVTGVAGGSVTAALALAMTDELAPVAFTVAVAVPVLVTALICWQIRSPRSAPAGRWIVGAAGIGALLIAVPQFSWDGLGEAVMLAVVYGSVYGLLAAVPAIVVLVPVVLVLWARVAWPVIQTVVVAAVMVWTAVFTYLLATDMNIPVVLAGSAAALAGVGAVLTTRPGH